VADANKQRSVPGTEWKKTCGAASDVTPKFVSLQSPCYCVGNDRSQLSSVAKEAKAALGVENLFDVTDDGTKLANKRLFIDPGQGTPDGFRVDVDGNLWCGWGMGEGMDGLTLAHSWRDLSASTAITCEHLSRRITRDPGMRRSGHHGHAAQSELPGRTFRRPRSGGISGFLSMSSECHRGGRNTRRASESGSYERLGPRGDRLRDRGQHRSE
jgi:hypothetical protein